MGYETIGSFAPFNTSTSELEQFLRDYADVVTTTYLYNSIDTGWHSKGRTGVYNLVTQRYSGGTGHTVRMADETLIEAFNYLQTSSSRPFYASGNTISVEETSDMYRVVNLQPATFGDIYLMWRLQAEFFNNYTTGWPHILVAMNPSMVKQRVLLCPNGSEGGKVRLRDGAKILINSSGVSVTDYRPNAYSDESYPKGPIWTTVKYDRNVDPDRRPADINIAIGVTISFGPTVSLKPIVGFEYQGEIYNLEDTGWEPFEPSIKQLQEKPKQPSAPGFDFGWTVATFLNYSGDYQEGELLTKGSVIIPGTVKLFDSVDFSIIRPLLERSGVMKGLESVRSQDVQATLVNISRVGTSREMKLTFHLVYEPISGPR